MMSATLLRSAICLFFVLTVDGIKAQDIAIWHRDYSGAVQEAKSEGKNLLVVFTGTDWIPICRKFHDDILSQPAFINAVSTQFSLLKLEYPKDNKLPREEAAQKALLKDAYRVRGFPTVVLTDANGRPFGMNGYQPVTPEVYAAQITDIAVSHTRNLASMKEAEALEGIEKAKRLSQGIPDLPGNLAARYYRKEMEAVLASDPEDTLKRKTVYTQLMADVDYSREMQELARKSQWSEMLALSDRYILESKLEGEALQKTLLNKAGIQRRLEDAEGFVGTLQKIIEIDAKSDSGAEALRQLEAFKKSPSVGGEAR